MASAARVVAARAMAAAASTAFSTAFAVRNAKCIAAADAINADNDNAAAATVAADQLLALIVVETTICQGSNLVESTPASAKATIMAAASRQAKLQ